MGCSPSPVVSCTTVVVVNVNVNVQAPGPPIKPPTPKLVPLVLNRCDIDAHVSDIHSFVTLSHEFHNPNLIPASGIYTFSMLASSAICGFKIIRGNGEIIDGEVKDRVKAQEDYDNAVKAGKTAALGKEETKDIFTICVGNLDSLETLIVKLSYINTLIDQGDVAGADHTDPVPQLRFTVPRAYVQRYGTAPSGDIDRNTKTDIPFQFKLYIQQVDEILNIQTPTGEITPAKGSKTATVAFDSSTKIPAEKDIIIIITVKGLDKPRAFIEPHPLRSRNTTAIALSWMPGLDSAKYRLPPPPEMEYIILIDRSSSMKGIKLKAVKEMLQVLLTKLTDRSRFYPYRTYPDAFFNIFSYGDLASGLWPSSKKAESTNIEDAISEIKRMTANMGEKKDILNALKVAFKALRNPESEDRPVSIFLMTDGAVYNVQECMREVRDRIIERQQTIQTKLGTCPPAVETFLRVFTIGLGHGVSTELCDGVARAGGGYSAYITQYTTQDDVLGRCQRLVAASQMPPIISDFNFSWDKTKKQPLSNPNAWSSRQAPQVLPDVFPYTRSNAYKILGTKGEEGQTTESHHSSKAPFIHVCAAKAVITDYEDALYLSRFPREADEIKKEIIKVGIIYQLTSRYTSFVVIDDGVTVGASKQPFDYTPDPVFHDLQFDHGHGLHHGHGPVKLPESTFLVAPNSVLQILEASEDIEEPTDVSILSKLIQLQQSDGGFGESSRTAIKLTMQYFPSTAYTSLAEGGYQDKIIAVLLTHSWISLKCPEEGLDTQVRADQWLETNAESVDIEAIHSYLSKIVT
ncbi:hypothetical protein Clacol_007931 [Clathrus columnatus]|uniref:Uncharacterized protein n=1 Tax=Clathrus columnatus TaxID=1419009 RepID=A0AAV5AP33_9AGAM|nr:hypothetical protein Clacol_007931 [Clathrus columnatus]